MTEITHILVSQLKPLENNPRRISKDQMAKLIKSLQEDTRFLECRPILVNHTTNEDGTHLYQVYAGNQRLQAAKKLKWKSVPCIVDVSLDPAVMKSRIVKDNKTYGEFDYDILNNEYSEYLLDAGFTEQELSGSFGDVEDILSTEEDTDETLEPCKDEDAITKVGDVYELDGHIVICGDSTNIDVISKLFKEIECSICFTSPPYDDQRDYNNKEKLSPEYLSEFIPIVSEKVSYFIINLGIKRKDGEVYSYWDIWINKAKYCGLKFLSWNIWDQGFSGSVGKLTAMFPICHEWIFVFGPKIKKNNPIIPNKTAGKTKKIVANRQKDGSIKHVDSITSRDFRELGSVFRSPPQLARDGVDHPARFPVDFPASYIKSMTDEGDYVYDPFLGSGTTLIAAEQLKRKCIGVEISPAYVDIIVNRWINWRKKQGLEHSFKKNGVEIQEL